MPNCFSLSPKANPDKPANLIEVDQEICKFLGVPCDDVAWHDGWYDMIGFRLACGKSFDDIRLYLIDYSRDHDWACKMLRVVNFLDENYISNSWVEIGRRA